MQTPLRLLSAEDMQAIHDAALRVLAATGMLVDHEKAREILAAAGAHVNHDTKMVRFPPELVEAKLKLVPRETVYHGRTPEFDFTLSAAGPIYSRVAGGATHYYDLETGQNRRGTLADWRQFCTLVDALPQIHSVATMHCGDVPAATADLHSLLTLYECQRKVIVHNAFSFQNAQRMIEMALALRGSKEAVAQRPPYRHMLSPISPLFLNEDDTAQLLLCCEYGIPTDIPIMPTAATTSPITLAGTLMQSLAEYLGTMTLAQCARPGHNMPFFVDPVVADLRTSTPQFAAPEVGLLCAAICQMGVEFYGLAPEAIGLDSDGFTHDQTLFQKAQNTIFQVMAGGKLVIGAGLVESSFALDPAQLVLDNEIMVIAKRWVKGFAVNADTLAVDALTRVGPRGNFLIDDHTLKFLRSGELIRVDLFARERRDVWESKGAKGPMDAARDKAKTLLAKHEVPRLEDAVARELRAIVAAADAALVG